MAQHMLHMADRGECVARCCDKISSPGCVNCKSQGNTYCLHSCRREGNVRMLDLPSTDRGLPLAGFKRCAYPVGSFNTCVGSISMVLPLALSKPSCICSHVQHSKCTIPPGGVCKSFVMNQRAAGTPWLCCLRTQTC
jgi:hypothetical protein